MFLQIYMYTQLYPHINISIYTYIPTYYLHTYIPTYLPTNPSPCRAPPSLCFPGGSRAVPTFAVTGGDGDAARPEDLRVASAGGGASMAVEGSKQLNPQQKPENYRTLAPDFCLLRGVWWYCRFKDLKYVDKLDKYIWSVSFLGNESVTKKVDANLVICPSCWEGGGKWSTPSLSFIWWPG